MFDKNVVKIVRTITFVKHDIDFYRFYLGLYNMPTPKNNST